MVLGPLQTLSNGIYDEKTIGIAGINFVQFDWFIVVSYHLLDLLDTVGRSLMVLGPLQTQSNVISDEKTTVGSPLKLV